MWEPIGPLPAPVYRRRRLLAGAAVLGAVVLVGGVIGGSALTGPRPAAVTERAVVGSAETGLAAPDEAGMFGSASPAAPAPGVHMPSGPTPPDGAPQACTNSMLAVAAEIDRTEHRVGQQPMLRLVVTNIGAQPCVRDLDPARQEIVVWSEDLRTRLWSSNDCSNPSTRDLRTLLPNQPLGFQVTWAGRTTTPDCEQRKRTVVPAGSYNVMTRLDDVISPPAPLRRLP